MKYRKIAILSNHSNILYKRRLKPLEQEAVKYNINIINYSSEVKNIDILIIQKIPETIWELREILKKDFFIIYDNSNYLGVILPTKISKKIPLLGKNILSSIIKLRIHPHIKLRKIINRANLVVTGSKKQADFFINNFKKKTLDIVDPINKFEFSGQKRQHKENNFTKILWEGTEASFLQLEQVIIPLIELKKKHEFELIVFTDISKNSNAEKLFNLLQENIRVRHVAWDKNKIDEVMLSSDIAIAPIDEIDIFNYTKPFNKLLVYWAYGLPVVCSNIPSYKRVMFNEERGFCCDSIDKWTESLQKLIENHKLRKLMGEKGYDFTWNNHSQEIYAKNYFKKINELYKII